jgi:hypothetical protein
LKAISFMALIVSIKAILIWLRPEKHHTEGAQWLACPAHQILNWRADWQDPVLSWVLSP